MRDRRVGIIVQARVGSSRFPCKVVKQMAGQPMIGWVIERLKACQRADELVLATSDHAREEPLIKIASEYGVAIFRGSENDVLDRYYRCALEFEFDDIVRATGDNPFVDPAECDRLIAWYLSRSLDYAALASDPPDAYPKGVWVEVFGLPALTRSWREGRECHHREHVNEFILENQALFNQNTLSPPEALCAPELSLTVDTKTDFLRAEKLYVDFQKERPGAWAPVTWAIRQLRSAHAAEARGENYARDQKPGQ